MSRNGSRNTVSFENCPDLKTIQFSYNASLFLF